MSYHAPPMPPARGAPVWPLVVALLFQGATTVVTSLLSLLFGLVAGMGCANGCESETLFVGLMLLGVPAVVAVAGGCAMIATWLLAKNKVGTSRNVTLALSALVGAAVPLLTWWLSSAVTIAFFGW